MSTPRLRILVDLTRLHPDGESGGIKPALRETFRWLRERPDTGARFVFLTRPRLEREVSDWLGADDRLIPVAGAFPQHLAAREACDLVYCPFGMTDCACPGIPTLTLIVDLLHKDFPETLAAEELRYRNEYFAETIAHTDRFQVISDYTSRQLQSHYGIAQSAIVRTYLPVHGRLKPAIRSESPKLPYFFYPANAWAHKNHETLLVAYALYRQQAGAGAWQLVLTGNPDMRMRRVQEVAENLGVADYVDFPGYVDEETLMQLWQGASALVFPSLHEGFGIPLLEAMSSGVPILASDATAVPEIAGDAALLVDARAPLLLASQMEALAKNPTLRQYLTGKGRQRLKDFSAAHEFGRLLEAFRQTARASARWKQAGYHPADGLIDPLAIFALPLAEKDSELCFATRPLGIARTLEFWCGPCRVAVQAIPPDMPANGKVMLPAGARTVELRVPDASRLSPTDPRTHGVLLETLQVREKDGVTTDLLVGCPTP